jgi:chorismate-pyruvate lyase
MHVLLHFQERITDAPPEVRQHLGGAHWLCRVTSLCTSDGQVLMDNLSFTRLDVVPAWFLQKLDEGQAPIGHMLKELFVRRESVDTSDALQDMLWSRVGVPDRDTSRSYRIVTPQGPLMLIFEVFRGAIRGPISTS